MSVPTTPSASSTSVSPDPRRSGTSRTGAEDRNVHRSARCFESAKPRLRRNEEPDDKNRLLQSGTRRRKGCARR